MARAPHWKRRLREKCDDIFKEMKKRYDFDFIEEKSNRNACVYRQDNGRYELHSAYPSGYSSLGIFLHECGHIAHGDLSPGQHKPDLFTEVRAWGCAKAIMAEFGLAWVTTVSNMARACLTSHARDSEPLAPGSAPAALIAALKKLDGAGI